MPLPPGATLLEDGDAAAPQALSVDLSNAQVLEDGDVGPASTPAGPPASPPLVTATHVPTALSQPLSPSPVSEATGGTPPPAAWGGFPMDNSAITAGIRTRSGRLLREDQQMKARAQADAAGGTFEKNLVQWRAIEPELFDVYHQQDFDLLHGGDWRLAQQQAIAAGAAPDAAGANAAFDVVDLGDGRVAVRRRLARQLQLPGTPDALPGPSAQEILDYERGDQSKRDALYARTSETTDTTMPAAAPMAGASPSDSELAAMGPAPADPAAINAMAYTAAGLGKSIAGAGAYAMQGAQTLGNVFGKALDLADPDAAPPMPVQENVDALNRVQGGAENLARSFSQEQAQRGGQMNPMARSAVDVGTKLGTFMGGLLAGGPAGAMAVSAGEAAGGSYSDFLQHNMGRGLDEQTSRKLAFQGATASGGIEAAVTRLFLGIGSKMPGTVTRRLASWFGEGVIGTGVGAVAERDVRKAATGQDTDPMDIVRAVGVAGPIAVALGLLTHGLPGRYEHFLEKNNLDPAVYGPTLEKVDQLHVGMKKGQIDPNDVAVAFEKIVNKRQAATVGDVELTPQDGAVIRDLTTRAQKAPEVPPPGQTPWDGVGQPGPEPELPAKKLPPPARQESIDVPNIDTSTPQTAADNTTSVPTLPEPGTVAPKYSAQDLADALPKPPTKGGPDAPVQEEGRPTSEVLTTPATREQPAVGTRTSPPAAAADQELHAIEHESTLAAGMERSRRRAAGEVSTPRTPATGTPLPEGFEEPDTVQVGGDLGEGLARARARAAGESTPAPAAAAESPVPHDSDADVVEARKRSLELAETHKPLSPAQRQRAATEDFEKAAPTLKYDRVAVIVTGPPGAGKSTIVDPMAEQLGAYVADADRHKLTHPAFAGGLGAFAVHPDSTDINRRGIVMAAGKGANLIIPTLGRDAADLQAMRDGLREAGYQVHLVQMHVPPAVAAQRVVKRWRQGGQGFIDPAWVYNSVGETPRKVYDELRGQGQFDSFAAFNNDVPHGQPPLLTDQQGESPAVRAGQARRRSGDRGIEGGQPKAPPAADVVKGTADDGHEPSHPADLERPGTGEGAEADDVAGRPQAAADALPADAAPGAEAGQPGSVRASDGGAADDSGGGGDLGEPVRAAAPEPAGPEPRPAGAAAEPGSVPAAADVNPTPTEELAPADRNHVIEPDDVLAPATPSQKFAANVKAIDLLKQLEAEHRNPAPSEKRVLAQYTGWGWAGQYFKEGADAKNARQLEQLKKRMSDEELRQARESTLNAHYTAAPVIRSMWDMVRKLGFTGGTVLEPAVGVGHFIGLAPPDIAARSRFTAVDLDSLSARIATKLYPQADVRHSGFEKTRIPNNSIALAISNVPFGKFTVGGTDYPKLSIHDYFFARGLDKVQPGGIVAFITSHYSLDKVDPKVRKLLADKADLVAAVRLPSDAFAKNAGTEVTTDIIFLRKKDGAPFAGEPFQGLATVGTDKAPDAEGKLVDTPIRVNEYFARHPEMVMGEHSLQGTMNARGQGGEYTLKSRRGEDLGQMLAGVVDKLPAGAFGAKPVDLADVAAPAADAGEKDLAYVERDGQVLHVVDGQLKQPDWTQVKGFGDDPDATITPAEAAKRREVALDWVRLKGTVRKLMRAEIDPDAGEAGLSRLRKQLNEQYDAYVKKHGTLTKRYRYMERAAFLQDDPEYPLLQALENEQASVDPKTGKEVKTWTKADVFTNRTRKPIVMPKSVGSVGDAVNVSLGYRNTIDVPLVARLTNQPEDVARQQILDSGRALENPATGLLEPTDRYLSGNVRNKLAEAEAAAKEDPKRYGRNVERLKAVQPADIPLGEIHFGLASRWVPGEVLGAFAREIGLPVGGVTYNAPANDFVIEGGTRRRAAVATPYDTDRVTAMDLFRHALRGTDPRVMDPNPLGRDHPAVFNEPATRAAKQSLDRMKRDFQSWVKTTEATMPDGQGIQVVMQDRYNQTNNAIVPPEYNGDHLVLPGLSDTVHRLPHRLAMVARGLQEGNGVMAHGVGSGKTFTQIVLAHEMKRLGLANKPMIVVQKATLGQFAASYRTAYPDAKILVADEKSFGAGNRERFMSRIAMGDYEAVIVTQPQFERIYDSPAAVQQYFNQQLDELGDAIQSARAAEGKGSPTVKQLEAAKKGLQAKLDQMIARMAQRADNALGFQDLGVDSLMIDEAHAYKRIPIVTRKTRVKGIPTDSSLRAMSLAMRTKFIQDRSNGRNVFLATGTPITNTMAEAYVMMKLASPNVLAEYGISNFDEWANTFGDTSTNMEYTWAGKFRQITRFNQFVNLPELIAMIRASFDVKMGNKELGLKVPDLEGGQPELVVLPQTPAVDQAQKWLLDVADQYEQLQGEDKILYSWIPITTMQVGMAAALDPRLVHPSAADEPGSKVNQAIGRIVDIWRKSKKALGTQLVFADRFKPMNTDKLRAFAGGQRVKVDVNDPHHMVVVNEPENEDDATGGDAELARQEEADYKAAGFNLYHDIKGKLVKAGIPAEQIAVIHDANTDAKRVKLFEALNAGKVRVLLGSTEKMGVGVNVQKRLIAEHHLDPPRMLTPAMLEQRVGRMIRQGNDNPLVHDIRYGVEQTMDTGIYQMLENKDRFTKAALSGKATGRTAEDSAGEVSMSLPEMRARLTGNPLMLRHLELSQKIAELRAERYAFESERSAALVRLSDTRRHAQDLRERIPAMHAAAKQAAGAFAIPEGADTRQWTLRDPNGKEYTDRKDVVSLIDVLFDKAKQSGAKVFFKINDRPIGVSVNEFMGDEVKGYQLYDDQGSVVAGGNVKSGAGVLQSLATVPERMGQNAKEAEASLAAAEKGVKQLSENVKRPWERAGDLEKMEAEARDIEDRLTGNKLVKKIGRFRGPPKRGEQNVLYHHEENPIPGDMGAPLGAMDDPAAKLTPPTTPRVPLAPLSGGQPKRIGQILLDFHKAVGKEPRRANPGRGLGGIYSPGTTRTLVRFAGDLDKNAHEIAHFLDDRYGLVSSWARPRARSPFDKELIPNFSGYGSVSKSGPRSKLAYQRGEGVAEWLRALVVNPDAARAAAPKFAAHYDKTVPLDVRGAIHDFSHDVRRWGGQPAAQRQLSNVRVEHAPGQLEKLTAALRKDVPWFTTENWTDKLDAAVRDQLAPVMKGIALAKSLRTDLGPRLPAQDPEILIRLLPGFNDKYTHMLDRGLVDQDLQPKLDPQTGAPLTAKYLFEPLDHSSAKTLRREAAMAIAYGVSERVIEKAGQIRADVDDLANKITADAAATGDPVAILKAAGRIARLKRAAELRIERLAGTGGGIYSDEKQAAQALADIAADPALHDRVKEAARRYRTFARATLEHYRDMGRLSPESFDAIVKKNQFYFDFHRIVDDIEPRAGGGKRLSSSPNLLQRFKGGTHLIENPYVNLLNATYKMYFEADRNAAKRAIRDLLVSDRKMYQPGMKDLDQIGRQVSSDVPGAIKIVVNGKPEYWTFEPGMHKALTGFGQNDNPGLLWRLLTLPGRILRVGVTHSPPFQLRNVIRDSVSRGVLSEHGAKPWDVLMPGNMNADQIHQMKLAGGGQFGHYMASSEAYHAELQRRMHELAGDKNTLLLLPGAAWRAWHKVSSASELVGRMSEYRAAYDHARNTLGYDDTNASLYAAHQARDLLDFAVAGWLMKRINQMVPFTNAGVQGVARAFRGARKNPRAFSARWAAYVLVPTVAAYLWHLAQGKKHEEEYRQLPAYRRDFFWNFKVGHLWASIPKPFELGVFAAGVERMIEAARGAPHAAEGYVPSLGKSLLPFDEAAAVGPLRGIIEDVSNYSFFYGRSIVPDYEEGKDLRLRDTTRASRLGQAMQKVTQLMGLGVDARKIDNFIFEQTGGLGRLAMDVSDVGRGDRQPERFLHSTVGLSTFPPAYAAADVQAVMHLAQQLGEENSPRMRRLRTLLQVQQRATDAKQRDELAEQVRTYASGLRQVYERDYEAILARRKGNIDRRRAQRAGVN